jgi:ABC-type branched-subunit amino acid transport system substrate-binding protein/outer membrane protein assembly factor BamD (BamD/ComL family)
MRCSLLVCLLFLAVKGVGAQGTPEDSIVFNAVVEKIFVEGMRSFQEAKYDSAAHQFMRCLQEFPQSHRATGAYIMAAKSYYRLGHYREAVRLLKTLLDLYPHSAYTADAHYTLGMNYYRMSRYEDAAAEFLHARQATTDELIIRRSELMLASIAAEHLSVGQLQLLIGDAVLSDMKVLLTFRLAEKVFRAGDPRGAQELLRPLITLPPTTKYLSEAIELLQRVEKGGVIKIGVVLPLMLKMDQPGARDLGMDMLDAIKLAVDEHNMQGIPKVNIEVRDSERDPAIAAKHVTDLCADEKIVAILGPVFSNEAMASAGVANAKGVPIISPTATSNGIAAIGPFVFQANPDYDTRGRAIARFAIDSLQAKRLAVVAPIDAVGKLMAEAFVSEVKKDSLEVVDVQWYQSGATDLRQQLMAMRQKALEKVEETIVDFSVRVRYQDVMKMVRLGVPQKRLDSLMEVGGKISVQSLLGSNGARIADSLGIPTVKIPVKYDSLLIPVQTIDAIFLPIASASEIGIITSQLRYFNFQAQLLGTGDWENIEELELNRQYTAGVIFTVDSYVDALDQAYQLLAAKYQRLYNRKPSKNALYAYDSIRLLLHAVALGARNRQQIAVVLPTIRRLRGVHSTISMSPSRVNSYLHIMRYLNRTMKRIGEVDLTDYLDRERRGRMYERETQER